MKARSSAIASMDHNNEIVLKFLPRGASQRGKDFNWGGGMTPNAPRGDALVTQLLFNNL